MPSVKLPLILNYLPLSNVEAFSIGKIVLTI